MYYPYSLTPCYPPRACPGCDPAKAHNVHGTPSLPGVSGALLHHFRAETEDVWKEALVCRPVLWSGGLEKIATKSFIRRGGTQLSHIHHPSCSLSDRGQSFPLVSSIYRCFFAFLPRHPPADSVLWYPTASRESSHS